MTPEQAEKIFQEITSDPAKAGRWMPAVQTLIVQTLGQQMAIINKMKQIADRLDQTSRAAIMMAKELEQIRRKLGIKPAEPAPVAEEAEAEPAIEGSARPHSTMVNGTRVGADGLPLSPEQAAAEDAMDAATGEAPMGIPEPFVIPSAPRPPGPPQRRQR
jgi:hypothetical protein